MFRAPGEKKELLWLLLIIFLGAFLRLYKLDFQSLSNDELSSWNLSKNESTVLGVIKTQAEHDVNPPGYQILLFYIIHNLGDSEFWLRLPSAIAGILALLMIYLLGKKLFTSDEGLIAAALTAVSWCSVFYSQEARTYSFLFLFSIITIFFWTDLTLKSPVSIVKSYLSSAGYAVSAILTISLHYFGLLLVFLSSLGMLSYLLITKRPLKNFFIVHGIIFLAFLPFIPPLLIDFNPSFKTFIEAPTPFMLIQVFLFYFNNSYWFLILTCGLYFYLLIKIIYEKRFRYSIGGDADETRLILFIWLFIPFVAAYLISFFLPVLTERNMIISLPAAYLLLSHAIVQLPLRLSFKRIFVSVLAFAFLFHLIVKTEYYTTPVKPQYRETAEYIVKKEQKKDPPFIICFSWSEYMFNYYFKKAGSDFRVSALLGEKNDIDTLEYLIEYNDLDYFWYLAAHREPDKQFVEFLKRKYNATEVRMKGAFVMFCRRN